jgi:DNA-binding PadR family transcriptional regulator
MAVATATQGTPVRFALLALLADEPAHGYQLKLRFERSVGGVWPLNVGQVYDALRRLERDGLVEPADGDGGERRPYRATEEGRRVASAWLSAGSGADAPARDELAIRILVGHEAAGTSFPELVQRQREACMARLQRLARSKEAVSEDEGAAELALLDLLMLRAQADARWLDVVEARLGPAPRKEEP